MAMDQIFFGWSDFFKLIFEVTTIALPIALPVVFITSSPAPPISFPLSFLIPLFLLVVLLVIMRIVEKEMFEVFRGLRSGKIWNKKQ